MESTKATLFNFHNCFLNSGYCHPCIFQEVVYATAADLSKLPYDGLAEGFYLVGSGNTGVATSLACIGMYKLNIQDFHTLRKIPPPPIFLKISNNSLYR